MAYGTWYVVCGIEGRQEKKKRKRHIHLRQRAKKKYLRPACVPLFLFVLITPPAFLGISYRIAFNNDVEQGEFKIQKHEKKVVFNFQKINLGFLCFFPLLPLL
jgi:hypothetical protein